MFSVLGVVGMGRVFARVLVVAALIMRLLFVSLRGGRLDGGRIG